MRLAFVLLVSVSACGRRYPVREVAGPLAAARVAVTPRVITAPAAILFWLPGADTLERAAASEAWDAILTEAHVLRQVTAGSDIAVAGTHAAQLYVMGPAGFRRTLMLTGLDYPWGVVLVDPGYPEEILTGPIDEEELVDLAWDYFQLDDGGHPGFRAAFAAHVSPLTLRRPGNAGRRGQRLSGPLP